MKEAYYFHDDTVIINYSKVYVRNSQELLDCEGFNAFLHHYMHYLEHRHFDLHEYLFKDHEGIDEVCDDIITVMKLLLVLDYDQVGHPYVSDRHILLEIIEEGYHFWRSMQRYSFLYTQNEEGYQMQSFISADGGFNATVLGMYRLIQQKVQGSPNKVYRQLQAGTNAALLLQYYKWDVPAGYEALDGIPFIHEIMMRTPLIVHPKSNKRTNVFSDADHNPIEDFIPGDEEWVCFPAKVGQLMIFCYFHRNYITSAVATANLFELAGIRDVAGTKPDAIMIFGNPDGKDDTVFYQDKANGIWVAKNSASEKIDYFGYTKKTMLTLHNLVMMERGWLPIHGALVNIYLKDGTKKGLMFMGDSGAGKSETIEALSAAASDLIDHQETVFDDMGTIHLDEEGNVRAQGTEIGAFVRLDDLDKGTAYKDMDRSIFFNPEKSNARVVIPAAPYDVVTTDHKIDCFLYANNYTDKRGMHFFEDRNGAEEVFVQGKRFALGTTQEKGYTTTFFANPFGPMQRQEQCSKLITKLFDALYAQNIPVGEIYTCLGLPNKGDHGIDKAAEALLDFVKNGKKN